MSSSDPTQLLALLVHRGLLTESVARAAFASRRPREWLIEQGHCTAAQWQEWATTDAGARPRLTRYDLGEQIGEGGMARVFRARDKVDGKEVALKVLRPELARDPAQRERFVKEARLLIELEHPHVVKGLRVAKEGDVVFFAMDLVPGRCLQDVLGEQERLDEELALQVVAEAAEALAYLHDRALVHRDVKPGNLLWSEERGTVLIDLGFAVAAGAGGAASETTAGTVHYIAPEQAKGEAGVDARADVYALGATLYHLVTGSLPFSGGDSEEVLRKQVLESLSGERIRALGLSPQVHYFIEKMMAKERELRFQDLRELAAEVHACVDRVQRERELEEQLDPRKARAGRQGRVRRRRRR